MDLTSGVEAIDAALRQLAPSLSALRSVPELLLVQPVGAVLELTFTRPASPPAGVVGVDATTWAVPLQTPDSDQPPAQPPWPALTGIGTSWLGTKVLLNLATSPVIITSGAGSRYAVQVLRAISLDYVRSPWAEPIQLHVVGIGYEAAVARPDRVTYHEQVTEAVQTVAHRCARSHSPNVVHGGWVASGQRHVILCPYPSDRHRHELLDLLRTHRDQVAVALADDTDAADALDGAAHLDCDSTHLTANGRQWVVNPRRVDVAVYAEAAETLPPPRRQHPSPPRGVRSPEIWLLGPVELVGVDTSAVSTTHLAQITQLVAYLAVRPGAAASEIGRELVPDARDPAGEIHARASRARSLLGEQHLPYARDRRYDLRDVWIDLHEFTRLLNRSGAQDDLFAAADLEQAVALVRGRPFGATDRYAWAVHLASHTLTAVLEAHHELAKRYLQTGRPNSAATTARAALRLSDMHPTATQDLYRALSAAAEWDQLYQARDRYIQLAQDRGLPTDPDTLALADDLLHHPH